MTGYFGGHICFYRVGDPTCDSVLLLLFNLSQCLCDFHPVLLVNLLPLILQIRRNLRLHTGDGC